MTADVDLVLRGPTAYSVAYKVLELMERHKAWPTAINFEIWTHFVADPEGPLARELSRLISVGEPLTDSLSGELAAQYLPKAKLTEQIRDAGDQLSKELIAVSAAIQTAQKSNNAYGVTLEGASKQLATPLEPAKLQSMVEGLSKATRRVQRENHSLEQRLQASTAEVTRLREHLEAVLDIDHFKNFNDTWGHQTGDQVIRYVASVIGRVGAPPRFAARYGGEEFAMIFPGETASAVAERLEEIRVEVSSRSLKRRSTNDDLGTVTISAGMAQRRKGEGSLSAMERADAALYTSKRSGRNRVTDADSEAKAA